MSIKKKVLREFAEEAMYAMDKAQAFLRGGDFLLSKDNVLKTVDEVLAMNPLGWDELKKEQNDIVKDCQQNHVQRCHECDDYACGDNRNRPEPKQQRDMDGWELCRRDEAEEFRWREKEWYPGLWSGWHPIENCFDVSITQYEYRRRIGELREAESEIARTLLEYSNAGGSADLVAEAIARYVELRIRQGVAGHDRT